MLGKMSHKPSAGLAVKSVIFALSQELRNVWMIENVFTDAQKTQNALFRERLGGPGRLNNRAPDIRLAFQIFTELNIFRNNIQTFWDRLEALRNSF